MRRLIALRVLATALLGAIPVAATLAQGYPAKPIKLIVPLTPGGSQDVIGRLFAQKVGDGLGQTIVVENKAGAGGVIATQEVAHAAPDGYTLLLSTGAQMAIEPALNPKVGYDPIKDFVHVVHLREVTGSTLVAALDDPQRLRAADVVILALPAPAYAKVIPVVARHLRSAQTAIVSGALSLAPLWLAELAASHGARPRVAAFGTTAATARTRAEGVAIMTVRERLAVAALPAVAGPEALATCQALFGDRFDLAESVLAVTLTNINPVAHAAMALANFTRIERGEAWPQYHYLTPAVARLVEAMDAERLQLAAAFG